MAVCPSHEQLARLLAEQLTGADLAMVQAHVEGCAGCQAVLEQLTAAGHTNYTAPPALPGGVSFLQKLMHQPPPGFQSSATHLDPGLRSLVQGASSSAGQSVLPSLPGYQLLAELGRGVSGIVYQARESATQRPVAVKWLRNRSAGPASIRFRREVEALAELRHPGLVRIFAVGEHQKRPFYVMELVEGSSLDRRLAQGPLPVVEAVRLVAALARAIHAAHVQGWVHRDLKPANVLLAADGMPKIADFGLAKHREDELRYTLSGAVVGTPHYMAPEQAQADGREVGPRADVYALGAILYECLTGRPPFQGPTVPVILEQVRSQPPVPPRQLRPDIPAALEAVCLRCLAKLPAERYAGADVLADDLEHCLQPRESPFRHFLGRFAAALVLLMIGMGVVSVAIGLKRRSPAPTPHENAATGAPRAPASVAARPEVPRIVPVWPWRPAPAEGVTALALAPGGKRLVYAAADRTLTCWDLAAQQQSFHSEPFAEPITALGFAPDGQTLAVGMHDGSVSVLHALTGVLRKHHATLLRGENSPVHAVALGSEGRVLAGLPTGIALWRRGGQTLMTYSTLHLQGVAVAPDGRTFACAVRQGTDAGIRLFDGGAFSFPAVPDAAPLAGLPPPVRREAGAAPPSFIAAPDVGRLLFSLDGGRLAAVCGNSTVRLWDTVTGKEQASLNLDGDSITTLAVSPDDRSLALGTSRGPVHLWDPKRGRRTALLPEAKEAVALLAFGEDGQALVVVTADLAVNVTKIAAPGDGAKR